MLKHNQMYRLQFISLKYNFELFKTVNIVTFNKGADRILCSALPWIRTFGPLLADVSSVGDVGQLLVDVDIITTPTLET